MLFSILLPTLGVRIMEIDRLLRSLSVQTIDDFEVVIVTQINHKEIANLVKKWENLKIKHIQVEEKGLSLARNAGLKFCDGEWIIISDDDCWYPIGALRNLKKRIEEVNPDILLTQIYDPEKKELYKHYSEKMSVIKNKFHLMTRSSIELMIKRSIIKSGFDENLGLGAKYVCGEEIDFLLRHFEGNRIVYCPDVSVYHLKKEGKDSDKQIVAKGALYAKNFNILVAVLICLRDLLKKRENNFKLFFEGYYGYIKRIR